MLTWLQARGNLYRYLPFLFFSFGFLRHRGILHSARAIRFLALLCGRHMFLWGKYVKESEFVVRNKFADYLKKEKEAVDESSIADF